MKKSTSYTEGYNDGIAGKDSRYNITGGFLNGKNVVQYASGYRDGESDRLLRVNAEKEPSANPESVSPYDEGYADGLAGNERKINLGTYLFGYIDGGKARVRHLVPKTADSRPTDESDSNTEESIPLYRYRFQTTPRIAFFIYRLSDALPLAECATEQNARLICDSLNARSI